MVNKFLEVFSFTLSVPLHQHICRKKQLNQSDKVLGFVVEMLTFSQWCQIIHQGCLIWVTNPIRLAEITDYVVNVARSNRNLQLISKWFCRLRFWQGLLPLQAWWLSRLNFLYDCDLKHNFRLYFLDLNQLVQVLLVLHGLLTFLFFNSQNLNAFDDRRILFLLQLLCVFVKIQHSQSEIFILLFIQVSVQLKSCCLLLKIGPFVVGGACWFSD